MKQLLLGILLAAVLSVSAQAQINPAFDPTSCNGSGMLPLINPTGLGTCVQNGQIVSMGGGRSPSTIWASAAGASITTTADTSCFSATGSGPGQTITPPNTTIPYLRNTFTLTCEGTYTSPAIGTVGIVSKIKWGSTTVATATSPGLSASSSNTLQWTAWAKCTVQSVNNSVANSSTVSCWGAFTYAQGAGATSLAVITTPFFSVSPVTVDTSAAFKIDLTLALASSLGTESLTGIGGLVKIEY